MLPGSSEWLIIFGVALLLFGPSKLPQLGGAIGASIRNFKKGMKGLHNEEGEDTTAVLPEAKDKKE
jgi:sec-independent protein translocase protein TatA